MLHRLYSVQDVTAEMYGPVFQSVNDGVARRNVVSMLVKVAKWDRDAYKLHFVGTFDDETGVVAFAERKVIDVNFPTREEVEGE